MHACRGLFDAWAASHAELDGNGVRCAVLLGEGEPGGLGGVPGSHVLGAGGVDVPPVARAPPALVLPATFMPLHRGMQAPVAAT